MARQKKAQEVITLTHDYKATFGSAHGKRVLQDLMKKAGMFQLNYVPGDPHGTAFNEGTRNLVLHIVQHLKMDTTRLQEIITGGEDVFEIE